MGTGTNNNLPKESQLGTCQGASQDLNPGFLIPTSLHLASTMLGETLH